MEISDTKAAELFFLAAQRLGAVRFEFFVDGDKQDAPDQSIPALVRLAVETSDEITVHVEWPTTRSRFLLTPGQGSDLVADYRMHDAADALFDAWLADVERLENAQPLEAEPDPLDAAGRAADLAAMLWTDETGSDEGTAEG